MKPRQKTKLKKTLKVNIDDEDFVMQIINNVPLKYDSLVQAVEEDINKEQEDQITVKRVPSTRLALTKEFQNSKLTSVNSSPN
jgi:hypothetical protein